MIKEHLIEWMPDYYTGSNVNAIQTARDEELQSYEASQERVIGDMYVSTAQDISKWENEYGIIPSEGITLLQRQQQMIAYIRGSGGATTKAQLLDIVNSFLESDDAEIEELPDQFLIKVIIPYLPISNVEEMRTVLSRFVQAHVNYNVEIEDDIDADDTVYANDHINSYYIVDINV